MIRVYLIVKPLKPGDPKLLVTFEKFPRQQQLHAESIMQYAAKKLMHPNLVKHLKIHVIGNRCLLKNTGCLAFVHSENESRHREFEIEIDTRVRKRSLLTALAHEMVHVKQYAKNELRDVSYKKNSAISWQGKYYIDVLYWDQPWEIEAYGLENGLVAKFLMEYQLFKFFKERKGDWIPYNE